MRFQVGNLQTQLGADVVDNFKDGCRKWLVLTASVMVETGTGCRVEGGDEVMMIRADWVSGMTMETFNSHNQT